MPKLTRAELAALVRSDLAGVPEAAKLSDDELITIALEDDPSLTDTVESAQEGFAREAEGLRQQTGAGGVPDFTPRPGRIPSPQDALVSSTEQGLGPVAKSALRVARPLLGGIQEGLTGGMLPPDVASTDSRVLRTAGNLVGGVGATVGAVATGGVPGLIASGAVLGGAMGTRTSIDKEVAKRQQAGADAHARGETYNYQDPTAGDIIANPENLIRIGGQAVVGGVLNALPPVLRPAGGKVINALAGAFVNSVGNTVPVAVDQAIDQGQVNPLDPEYRTPYTVAAAIGAAGGATGGAMGARAPQAQPLPKMDPPPTGKVYYDEGGNKQAAGDVYNGPTAKPNQGKEWTGDPGHVSEDGWTTVGGAVSVQAGPGWARARQVKVVPTAGGRSGVQVRLDDGTELFFDQAFSMRNDLTQNVHSIDPNRQTRRAPAENPAAPVDEPMLVREYDKPFGPNPQLKLADPSVTAAGVPPAVKATFSHEQEDGRGGFFPMYKIEGDSLGKQNGSTVSEQKLAELGIPVPPKASESDWSATPTEVEHLKQFWGDSLLDPDIQAALKSGPLSEEKALELLKLVDQKYPVKTAGAAERGAAAVADAPPPDNPLVAPGTFDRDAQRARMVELAKDPAAVKGASVLMQDKAAKPWSQETGMAKTDALTHAASALAGGLAGGAAGSDDDGFNWSMAMLGAGMGVGGSVTFREFFRKIGKEKDLIDGLSAHKSINSAYQRSSPGSQRELDISAAVKSAYESVVDDTFTPHAPLKREAEAWSLKNTKVADATYFDHGTQVLDNLVDAKFSIPSRTAEKFRTMIADVVKDDNNYERAMRIIMLRSDIEKRQNDLARRNEAFQWLQEYSRAKARGDVAQTAFYRQKLRSNPGIMRPLEPQMRGGVPPEAAVSTLHALEQEAMTKFPDVLQAADNWKQWGRGLLQEVEAKGGHVSSSAKDMIKNYFPVYDLTKMGRTDKISVGGTQGISKSKAGFMKQRGRQKVDQKIWTDLVGPFFKREIDQAVDMAKFDAANSILDQYDPYRNGTLSPTQPMTGFDAQGNPVQGTVPAFKMQPNGDYTRWEWSVPGEAGAKHLKVEGFLPTPLAAEVQKHFVPAGPIARAMDAINRPLKGYLIRASGGGFLLNNILGNTADMISSTPVTQWHKLPPAGLKAIAATILEGVEGKLENTRFQLSPEAKALADLSRQGREAHIGTEAASAEVTEQALAAPAISDKAIDPNISARAKAGRAITKPVRLYGRAFDTVREANENVTRLAHFIHLTQNIGTDPAQAGRIVNMVQGNYNPTNQTPRERNMKKAVLFWQFYKNAFGNWMPFMAREMAYGDQIVGGRGAQRFATAVPHGKKLAAVTSVGLAATLWNHLFFPDAEASLTDFQKEQFHIIVPNSWNAERNEWNLAYMGWPTPANVVARFAGVGGATNRLIHAAQGTGSGDEVERSWEQIKSSFGGLVHPIVGTAAALWTGKDAMTGQPVVEPGSTNWQAAAQIAKYPFVGLPGMRQMNQAARDAAEPNEAASHFIRRMIIGSVYQPLKRENQEVRALARAVAGGRRAAGDDANESREAALFRGEQKQFTPEEIQNILTGGDKVSWQGKVVKLSELQNVLAKGSGKAPDDPGAVAELTKTGKPSPFDVRKSGPVYLPTRDYLRALGPDNVLQEFMKTFQGKQSQGDAWRSAAVTIVQQLRNESKNWEVPASLMMMLQQAPSAAANSEILKRVSHLETQMDPQKQLGDQLGRKLFGQ